MGNQPSQLVDNSTKNLPQHHLKAVTTLLAELPDCHAFPLIGVLNLLTTYLAIKRQLEHNEWDDVCENEQIRPRS